MATQASDSIKQRSRTTTADELAVVVQRAQAFTNASGAAIAIGNTEELVCRARSGSSAPEVGTAMRVEGSFTGICIHSGKELRCDDAETDTRVDTAALRSLGIRSLVVTPIKDEGKVIGVLAVFAPTPHAFTITHVAVLKTMADQISALLQKERRSPREESHVEAPIAPPRPAAVPAPLPPVVIRPAAASPAATAAAPARTNGSSAPVIEPLKPVAIAAEITPTPVPFPKREEKRESRRPEQKTDTASLPRSNFGMLDAVGGESQRSKSSKLVIIGGIAVLLVAAVIVWTFVATRKSNQAAQQQPVQQPQTTAAATQPATAPAPTSNPAPIATAPATPVATPSTKPAPQEKPESRKNESQKNDKQNKPAPAPATVEMASSGPSKISNAARNDQPADVAPSLSVGSSASPSLNSLAKPVGSSAPSMLTQSDLVNAKAIRATPAVYPEIAKARRISGTVVVRVLVGKDGRVSNPRFVSGPMVFRDAAFDAVKTWLFKPATLNGVAIEQETEITVKFSSPS